MARDKKYTATNLIPAFRIAVRARNEMRGVGFTDNGGAIASATRVLDILGMHVCYPDVPTPTITRRLQPQSFPSMLWRHIREANEYLSSK